MVTCSQRTFHQHGTDARALEPGTSVVTTQTRSTFLAWNVIDWALRQSMMRPDWWKTPRFGHMSSLCSHHSCTGESVFMLKCSDSARFLLHVFGLKQLCMITHLSRARLVSDRLHPVWNKPIASLLLSQFFSSWVPLISRGFESGKIMTSRPFLTCTMTGYSCM